MRSTTPPADPGSLCAPETAPLGSARARTSYHGPGARRVRAAAARHGTPLLMLSTATVRAQFRALAAALPGVELHYAVKSLPHPAVVRALAEEGASFDVASGRELDLVRGAGVAGERCIHTHPVKADGEIEHALAAGCSTFVFDNESELEKLHGRGAGCSALLRLAFRSPDAQCDLSAKFGAPPEDAGRLLVLAADAGVRVRGLSFHAGSQLPDSKGFVEAIRTCRDLFDLAHECGLALDTLDIGGGFPVTYTEQVADIEDYCRPIVTELARSFAGVRVIAEPGRFISAPAMTLVTSVVGRNERDGRPWYYIDDGVYGSYSGRIFDHCRYELIPLREIDGECAPCTPSVVAGPTCDSIDIVGDDVPLPRLDCGDLLVSPMLGAYSWASATDFNFLPRARVIVE